MRKFEDGDKVRCISDLATGQFTKGKTYVVKRAPNSNDPDATVFIEFDDIGSQTNGWSQKFFEFADEFTPGDRVTHHFSGGHDPIHGEVVSHVPTVSVRWDNTGNVSNWPVSELAREEVASLYKVGDRVNHDGGGYTFGSGIGEIVGVEDGGYKIISDNDSEEDELFYFKHEILSKASPAVAPATAPKTRGQIIQELRKAAGLPEFVVGDVVASKWGWDAEVTAYDGGKEIYLRDVGAISYGVRYSNADQDVYTLKTPAPSTPAVAPQPQANQPQAAEFKVGDYVRVIGEDGAGRVGKIDDNDGTDYRPYLVTWLDEFEGDWFDASELEAWAPKVGDRVECCNKEETTSAGTVTAIGGNEAEDGEPDVTIRWDCTDDFGAVESPWGGSELMPSTVSPPVAAAFKRGDIVEITNGSLEGKWGIVSSNSPFINVVVEDQGHMPMAYNSTELKLAA